MCAINGFTWNDQTLITTMNEKTSHRGPDDTGIFCDTHISLGHNRLSILDLSAAGHQPMSTPDGRYTIVYNGEIYNFKELRAQLTGVSFVSNSDTEVVLHLFAREGCAMLPKLNGIFAFAIWDNQERTLTLARDQFGVKPLYYHHDENKLIFSSEAKAILAHTVDRSLDLNSLNTYMRFLYAVGPHTMWQSIKKLSPGTYAQFKDGKLSITQFSIMTPNPTDASVDELHAQIRATTREAVRSQMVSDRPVGIFLSGGLDSTIVAGLMAQEAQGEINSFSVGFDTSVNPEKFNADFNMARTTAKKFGFTHHEIYVSNQDIVDNFEACVRAMDEPVSNHIQVATYLMARKAKEHVAVVLGGDGGDEIFGGYDRYYYYHMLNRLRQSFPFLAKPQNAQRLAALCNKPHLAEKLVAPKGISQFFAMMSQKESHLTSFINRPFNNGLAAINSYIPFFNEPWDDYVNFMMWVDARTWLVDESLIRSDKLTMAHGLEQRVPLLDKQLVQLAYNISSKYKLHSRTQGKKIFKDAFVDMLPPEIVRAKKRGFFSPAAKWLRQEPLKTFAYEVLSKEYTHHTADMFNWGAINTMLDKHITRDQYNLNTIWSLMTFQVWAREYMG